MIPMAEGRSVQRSVFTNFESINSRGW